MRRCTVVSCKICGVSFSKDAYEAKHTENHFCSRKCYSRFQRLRSKRVRCKTCHHRFFKHLRRINQTKGNFCCKRCAAIYNNKKYPKRKKQTSSVQVCLLCSSKVRTPTTKFCSSSCSGKYRVDQLIVKWLAGEISGISSTGQVKPFVRKYLFKTRGTKCERCGWSELNVVTGRSPLQTHHKDGNYKNTIPDNLLLLCPNCHSLTETYMSLNKDGNGRPNKKQKRLLQAIA